MDAEAEQKLNTYIATFWTHLSALTTLKAMQRQGIKAAAGPVPRKLSASCGVCVRYEAVEPCDALMHRDYDKIWMVVNEDYQMVAENHDSQ